MAASDYRIWEMPLRRSSGTATARHPTYTRARRRTAPSPTARHAEGTAWGRGRRCHGRHRRRPCRRGCPEEPVARCLAGRGGDGWRTASPGEVFWNTGWHEAGYERPCAVSGSLRAHYRRRPGLTRSTRTMGWGIPGALEPALFTRTLFTGLRLITIAASPCTWSHQQMMTLLRCQCLPKFLIHTSCARHDTKWRTCKAA